MTGLEICKYQSKIRWYISLGQDATSFQIETAAILDCMTSCLKKELAKEQIIICTDSQAAFAALAASEITSLLIADCTEKLTTLSEENQVTVMRAPEHSSIKQNEAVDRLTRNGATIRPTGQSVYTSEKQPVDALKIHRQVILILK